ncbi:MAG: methyltransferase domain-containing protein [Bacteroidales bacterium]|nr:methyltransferase domain-containing protein [Bacteroidales bacterium]
MTSLTDREYWSNYWKNYEFKKLPDKELFGKHIKKLQDAKSFIEIGGFPGEIAAYFNKKFGIEVSILDFYIDKTLVNKVEQFYGIAENTIQCIESDFFVFQSGLRYDLVFSYGFIEHFEDTCDVLMRHVGLLSENGRLLAIIPNFRGINGFVQYLFDRETLQAHNLKSMVIPKLRKILIDAGLENIDVSYSKTPMIWLEPKPGTSKLLRGIIKLISYSLKLFPIPCRLLSPYIIIFAENKALKT